MDRGVVPGVVRGGGSRIIDGADFGWRLQKIHEADTMRRITQEADEAVAGMTGWEASGFPGKNEGGSMRSIGAWKIKKLKKIAEEELAKSKIGKYSWGTPLITAKENIKARIPEEWHDTWESAWSEIERLIDDCICNYQYGRKA